MGIADRANIMNLFAADNLARIASPEAICQEQILSPPLARAGAALIDQWGRIHRLGRRTTVGRRPGQGGIYILESSVSREHAELFIEESSNQWYVRDLSSKNGTLVNDDTIRDPIRISSGDAVFFGQVGFLFFIPPEGELASPDDQQPSETLRAEQGIRSPLIANNPSITGQGVAAPALTAAFQPAPVADQDEVTFVGLPRMEINLIEPSGGGGGFLEAEDKRVQLTATQFAFLQLLASRMRDETSGHESVRGFIRSSELLADLPWDTAHPEENHLKQLVRRVRRSLTRAGMGNLIESRRGFGYRLRVVPLP